MKQTFGSLIVLLAAALSLYCGKKGTQAEPQVQKQEPQAQPGPFGITRKSGLVTVKERQELALSVKNVDFSLKGTEKATIETNEGTFVAELYSKDAPNTVKNFIRLSESGFYDGLTWHRYVEGFVIQGGDPMGTGTGNPGYQIPFEKNNRKHTLGAMGMARGEALNSASCQFYICLAPQPGLDGSYVVFGKVIQGMDVVQKLRVGDRIVKITISKE